MQSFTQPLLLFVQAASTAFHFTCASSSSNCLATHSASSQAAVVATQRGRVFFHALSTALQLICDSSSTSGLPRDAASAALVFRTRTAVAIKRTASLLRFTGWFTELILAGIAVPEFLDEKILSAVRAYGYAPGAVLLAASETIFLKASVEDFTTAAGPVILMKTLPSALSTIAPQSA